MSSNPKIDIQIKITIESLGEAEIINTKLQHNGKEIETTILNLKLARPVTNEDIKRDVFRGLLEAVKPFAKGKLMVLSGRMPLWLAAYLTHRIAHLYDGVALFDPKVGCVVICTHWSLGVEEGDIIQLPEELKNKLVQV